MKRIAAILLTVLLVVGCASPFPEPVATTGQPVRQVLEEGVTLVHAGEDSSDVAAIQRGIAKARQACHAWASLRTPVRILVYRTAADFHRAIGRDYPWLSAWATERDIAVLSPQVWSRGTRGALERLMTHEMVHVLHYQAAGIQASQTTHDDPFWFREGLASVVAGEAGIRESRDRVAKALASDPSLDLLAPSASQLEAQARVLYSAAHHMMAWLMERNPKGVEVVMQEIRGRRSFEAAVEAGFGARSEALLAAWRATLPAVTTH